MNLTPTSALRLWPFGPCQPLPNYCPHFEIPSDATEYECCYCCVKVKLYFLSPDEAEKLGEDADGRKVRASNGSDDSPSIVSGGNALELSSAEDDDDDSLSETDDDDDAAGWADV